MHCYALRDDQWDKIKGFLPGRVGHVGATAADNRLFVDTIFTKQIVCRLTEIATRRGIDRVVLAALGVRHHVLGRHQPYIVPEL